MFDIPGYCRFMVAYIRKIKEIIAFFKSERS